MAEGRDRWSSRRAFILAAIGSAIGIGNIWRFPYQCAEFGGGAFLFAYLIALFTAGIPLLILEFYMGHKYQQAAPGAFKAVNKKFEFLGWWAVLVGFVIVTYYAIIMAWTLNYEIFSFTLKWGDKPKEFFDNIFLNLKSVNKKNLFSLGPISIKILIALVVTWIFIVLAIWKGAKTVSKVVYATVLIPWILIIVFVIRGVTLPGAVDGLELYLVPDFSKLANPKLWLAAYSQTFFSLSVGFAIMIAYSSFLPKKADIVNNAFIIAFADVATAFVGGFAVFGTLGYYAYKLHIPVKEALDKFQGFNLAFVTYPTIINKLGSMGVIFGLTFFLMLLTLAIDSAFSLVEAVASAARDKWKLSHTTSNIGIAVICILLGIILTTPAGYYWLDIVDHFANNFGIVVICFIECIVIGYFLGTAKARKYINAYSDIKIGKWWDAFIMVITPLILLALIASNIISDIRTPYDGYKSVFLFTGGWQLVVLLPIIGYLIAKSNTLLKLISHIAGFVGLYALLVVLGILIRIASGLSFKAILMILIPSFILFGGIILCIKASAKKEKKKIWELKE